MSQETDGTGARNLDEIAVKHIVEKAVEVLRETALNGDQVDWRRAHREALAVDGSGDDRVERALNVLVRALEDDHSFVVAPRVGERLQGESNAAAPDPPTGQLMANRVARVVVPGLSALDGTGRAGEHYSGVLNQTVRSLDWQRPAGWILDLRENDGGNMHPMLAGLAGLFQAGRVCGFRDRHGAVSWVSVGANAVDIDGSVCAIVPDGSATLARRMAILVSSCTASSGEWVALALGGQRASRLFGERTAGMLTGVAFVELPHGWGLGVTQVSAVDRGGEECGTAIEPDEVCGDDVIERAAEWVLARATSLSGIVERQCPDA